MNKLTEKTEPIIINKMYKKFTYVLAPNEGPTSDFPPLIP